MADGESRAARAAVQEFRVPKSAAHTKCRHCGASVVFVATGGGPKCLDLRTVRTTVKSHEMATQHRCLSGGGGRG